MQNYNKPKRKRDQPQEFLFAILRSRISFEFRTAYSLDDCVYLLRKLETSSIDELKVWYSEDTKTAVTITPYIGDAKQFLVQIRGRGRDRSITKYDGYLKPQEDGDTLIQGYLILHNHFFELLFCVIYTLLAIFIFQSLLLALGGASFVVWLLVSNNFNKQDHLRSIKIILGYKQKVAS
ncbi:MAG: hypothetical protein ABI947_16460 [Chloroflexota bacterium]